jgi:hypothetical protein
MISACWRRAWSEPLPLAPVGWTATCSGVDPALLGFRGSAPPAPARHLGCSGPGRALGPPNVLGGSGRPLVGGTSPGVSPGEAAP